MKEPSKGRGAYLIPTSRSKGAIVFVSASASQGSETYLHHEEVCFEHCASSGRPTLMRVPIYNDVMLTVQNATAKAPHRNQLFDRDLLVFLTRSHVGVAGSTSSSDPSWFLTNGSRKFSSLSILSVITSASLSCSKCLSRRRSLLCQLTMEAPLGFARLR